ncbi:virulence plasmid 65kDa B protein-domain-containing protein [Xylaria longipes]|nr:virulence plasmid 65kDa B protein-domain-containing protein [Xylaria longipes]
MTSRVNSKQAIQESASPFRVDAATGAVSLTVPTVVPPGRESDSAPNPQLIYNSLAGNGPFGIGWTLALSGISRKTSQNVPQYTNEDIFVLAGADDLVPASTLTRNGYVVRQYRPRVQLNATSIRVERWLSCTDDTDQFWRTISGSGLITLYGRTSASRIFDPSSEPAGTRLFSWLPSVTYDTKGNCAIYCYKEEDSANVDSNLASEQHRTIKSRTAGRYLKRIKYCNQTPFQDFDTWVTKQWEPDEGNYLFEIVFDYGEHADLDTSIDEVSPWSVRADVFSSYHSGFELRTYRLCRRVLLFHHFPESITNGASLLSSAVLEYRESPSGSTLVSVTQKGHRTFPRSANKDLQSESLAPLQLEYSEPRLGPCAPLPCDLLPITVDTSHLAAIPQAQDTRAQWIDLDGEGSPGILAQRPGGEWVYMRNESQGGDEPGSVTFAPPKALQGLPNLLEDGGTDTGFFTHLAADGTLQFVYMDWDSGLYGYYPRIESDWGAFVPFAQIPAADLTQAGVHWIDLVGNGRQDAVEFMVDDQNHLRWYRSLGCAGFAPARLEKGPRVPQQQSDAFAVLLADMTGDGLTDVVHVCNSDIAYWPNLGHGHFGARVRMDRSPSLDSDELFTAQRVLLADVDGTGSADMIYLIPGGGANIYLNQSGNSWSEPILLASVPDLSDLSSINIVDLLGRGLPCLCWTSPNTPGCGPLTLQYMELMGKNRPNQLTRYRNGAGLETSFEYCPSTKFYLADEESGRPWTTRLPFPVQCVSTITNIDNVALTRSTSTYAYHDGFYDSIECEFRGFGHVDCWESEDLAAASGLFKLQAPPRHSRTWYHTGSPLCNSSLDQWTKNELIKIGPSQMPSVPKDGAELRESKRALKGLVLRSEAYSDGGGAAGSSMLFETSESSYIVVMEQGIPIPGNDETPLELPHACFRVLERETIHKLYERNLEEHDARIQHHLSLVANQGGQPTKTVVISYGRQNVPDELDEETKAIQKQTVVTYTEHDYTNALDELDAFAVPQPTETRSYKLRDVQLPPNASLFSYDQLSENDAALFRELPGLPFDQDPGPLSSNPNCKILISQERAYYRSGDMKNRLGLGVIEPFSVLDQKYTLALTKGLLNQVFVDENQSTLLSGISAAHGAYVDLQNDGNWWIPSSRAQYCDPRVPWDPTNELRSAQSHFYIPEYTVNARGAVDYQELDSYSFLRTKTVDSLGNETVYICDYPFSHPVRVTDANDNVTEFAYDCFGALVGTAVKGKITDSLGDSLNGFVATLTDSQLTAFLDKPLETAPSLLGSAGSRRIYHRSGVLNAPMFEAEIRRSTHSSSPAAPGDFSVEITYLDGRGNTIQTAILHSTSTVPQWRLEGWQICSSNHRQAILTFHPCLTLSHLYRPRTDTDNPLPPAVSSIYDPLHRLVATLQPDHTWQTTTICAWNTVHKDAGDNVLVDDMAADNGVGVYIAAALSSESYLPSWYSAHTSSKASPTDKAAAEKAKIHNNTPDISYLDAEGHEILSVTSDNSSVRQTARAQLDAAGNVTSVFDTLNRVVSKSRFDICQRRSFQEEMDGRVDLTLPDALGLDWLRWTRGSENPSCQQMEHDDLGRLRCVWLRQKDDTQKGKLIIRQDYGESQPNAKVNNLRGRLYKTLDQSGSSTCPTYDFKGNLVQHDTTFATEYKSILNWSSDGEPANQTLETETYTDHAVYDALSRLCQTIAVDGSQTTRTYNASGQIDSIQVAGKDNPSSWTKYITSITYTASGQQDTVTYGNGVSTSYIYDPLTLLETRCTTWKQGRASKVVLRDVQTTYDCLSKRVHREDHALQDVYFRNQVVQPVNDNTYDARGQLIVATGREKVNTESNTLDPYGPQYALQDDIPSDSQLCNYIDTMTYDAVGNITQLQHVSSDAKVSGWTRSYEYGDGNRINRTKVGSVEDNYSYNSRGCITSMPGAVSMIWNYADQLCCTISQRVSQDENGSSAVPETSWYVYNASGIRVRKVTERAKVAGDEGPASRLRETLYLRQLTGFEVYREYSGQGEQVKSEKKTLEVTVALPSPNSRPIALVESISTGLLSSPSYSLLERYLLDQGLEVDDEGNLLSLEEYSPYGATTFRATDKKRIRTSASYRYSGYLRDTEETGLCFCNTRYYASWLGRWASPDPLGIADGLNAYSYVGNDPINYVDSCGTMRTAARSDGDRDRTHASARPSTSGSHRAPSTARRDLGIERHELSTGRNRVHLWSSVVKFEHRLTPKELTRAARMAYGEMGRSFSRLRKDRYGEYSQSQRGEGRSLPAHAMPTVMTAYAPDAIPKTVIFSSSAKAAIPGARAQHYYTTESHPKLRGLLTETGDARQARSRTEDHRTGGCGELGAINLAFMTDPDLTATSLAGSIVAYGRPGGDPDADPQVMNPCGRGLSRPQWGCDQLLQGRITPILERSREAEESDRLPHIRRVRRTRYF